MDAKQETAALPDSPGKIARRASAGSSVHRFSQATVNFLLDSAMLVVFLLHLWVSLTVEFIFPPDAGTAAASLWGYAFGAWAKLRLYSLCALAILILVHLVLHWNWICGYLAARLSRLAGHRIAIDENARTLYGVGTLITVLGIAGLLLLAAEFAVKAH